MMSTQKVISRVLSVLLVTAFFFTGMVPAQAAQAASTSGQTRLEEFLNSDGTLKLDSSFNGMIDIDKYNVQIDPQHGPVFTTIEKALNSQLAAPINQWGEFGKNIQTMGDFTELEAIAVIGTDVYVGGSFNIDGIQNIAKWDGAQWSALGSNNSINGVVWDMLVVGTDLYVGGCFENAGHNPAADSMAKWDGTTWSALGSNGKGGGVFGYPGYCESIRALAMIGTDLYAGGAFYDINNNGTILTAADFIAKWDGANWSALGSDGMGDGSIAPPGVAALAVIGSDLYVGGSFPIVSNNGTLHAGGLVKWNGSQWSALVKSDWNIGPVESLAVIGTDLYAAGEFYKYGTIGYERVIKWDGTNFSALGSKGAINNLVIDLAVNGTDLYVGGWFTNAANNNAADYVVKWDGTQWSALGSNGAGDGSINNRVSTLTVSGNNLYVGGDFSSVNNNGAILNATKHVTTYGITPAPIFTDSPATYWAAPYIERLYNAHITGGCITIPLSYCPDSSVTRAQMAVFLEKGLHGSGFNPPTATGTKFADVPTSHWAASWIEALAADGITGGCGNNNYCPDAEVTRAQMAVFLLKAGHGSSHTPPTASGTKFTDVPSTYWAAAWVEQLAAEGITSGCGTGTYCPDSSVTRAQMAVFLVKAFNLP